MGSSSCEEEKYKVSRLEIESSADHHRLEGGGTEARIRSDS